MWKSVKRGSTVYTKHCMSLHTVSCLKVCFAKLTWYIISIHWFCASCSELVMGYINKSSSSLVNGIG